MNIRPEDFGLLQEPARGNASNSRRAAFPGSERRHAALIAAAGWLAIAASVCGAAVPIAPTIRIPILPARRATPEPLPFTAEQITRYFTSALGQEPVLLGDSAIFTGKGSGHAEDAYEITVTSESDAVTVGFTGHGDYGLTLAREFFEAPFFERRESERFYQLLSQGRTVRMLRTGRFATTFRLIEHRDDFHLTLRFSPNPT